jgi:hypothetical protein
MLPSVGPCTVHIMGSLVTGCSSSIGSAGVRITAACGPLLGPHGTCGVATSCCPGWMGGCRRQACAWSLLCVLHDHLSDPSHFFHKVLVLGWVPQCRSLVRVRPHRGKVMGWGQ